MHALQAILRKFIYSSGSIDPFAELLLLVVLQAISIGSFASQFHLIIVLSCSRAP